MDDAIVDPVAGGFDVGFTLGEVLEKDMVGVRLGGDMRQIAVASPEYVARHDRPETPKGLHGHKCLRWRWPGRTTPYNWEFFKDGAWFEVEVDGPLILSEQTMAVDAAVQGMGIAFWIEQELKLLIEQGKLVPLLEEYSAPLDSISATHNSARWRPLFEPLSISSRPTQRNADARWADYAAELKGSSGIPAIIGSAAPA